MNAKGQVLGQWFVLETTPVRHPIILTCDKFQEHRISKHIFNRS